MSAVLDIIIICVIILCIYTGYKKGLVKTVMSLLSFVIAYIAARMFSPPISSWLYPNWIKPNFVSGVEDKISGFLSGNNTNLAALVKDPPDALSELFKKYGVDLNLQNESSRISEIAENGAEGISDVATNLVETVAKGISDFIAFAAVFIVALILLKIITSLINKAVKLPGLNLINRIGGTIVGGFYGFALSYIFVLLASYVLPYISANVPIGSADDIIGATIFFRLFTKILP